MTRCALLALALLPFLLGSSEDGGCGEVTPAPELCSETGGTWADTGCTCPSDRPFWQNGSGCGTGHCVGYEVACSKMPISRCSVQDGCASSGNMCTGTALSCTSLTANGSWACNGQWGCEWQQP